MFGTFLEKDEYTIPAIIEEIKREIEDTRLIKAAMPYQRHVVCLESIVDALEQAVENAKADEKGGAK